MVQVNVLRVVAVEKKRVRIVMEVETVLIAMVRDVLLVEDVMEAVGIRPLACTKRNAMQKNGSISVVKNFASV
jgi:hypothetical protein